MTKIEESLAARKLPAAVRPGEKLAPEEWKIRRAELIDTLSEEIFGVTPETWRDLPIRVLPDPEKPIDRKHTCAGKVETRLYTMFFDFPDGTVYEIPFILHRPMRLEKPPVIIHIAFHREYPDRYLPIEEITDRGYALLQFCYQDATPDVMHSDYTTGLAAKLIEKPRKINTPGNIGVWAFAASRMMDWIEDQPDLDAKCVSLSGHSRLAKTTLWCTAQDERFFAAFCNDSGYGGSGLIRGKTGENISDFLRGGSWCWFCEKFKTYGNDEYDRLPYDMHFLLSAIAPRYLYVASAESDGCMDYTSDFLSAAAATPAWEALGRRGLVTEDEFPVPGETTLNEGCIGYHVRHGIHYLSREDWNKFLDFLDKKRLFGYSGVDCYNV